jgi:hypothetical protein
MDRPCSGQSRLRFNHRATTIEAGPVRLEDEFANERVKSMQWTAFLRGSHLSSAPARVVSNLYLPISVETPLALQENIKQQRPILFLTSETQNLPSFSKSIIEWLKKIGRTLGDL